MRLNWFKYLFLILATGSFCGSAKAQSGLCPPNLDFEAGNFTNWVCQTGFVSNASGVNTVSLSGTFPVPGRHTIISTGGVDQYGGFPVQCPNGSNYSVKLGNNGGGHEAESISYTCTIPSTLTVFSILFHYAVVLQNPNHAAEEQPRFRARIIDLSNNAPIPCVNFDFTATSGLTGFRVSPVAGDVLFKDWTPVSINLSAYIGRTIMLEFITSDCTFTAHFGYAYIDVNSTCNGVISGTTICPGVTATTLTAPFGFQSYEWYSDPSFSTLLSNTQLLNLNPPPAVGSVFPVIVTPYPTFGCKDTLYATMSIGIPPASVAGSDLSLCEGQQAQIGGASLPTYTYSWSPANLVSNPSISNPFAWGSPPNPAEIIVTTTDILTGCYSTDTVIISTSKVDTSIRLTGKSDYCFADPSAGSLSASNPPATVQWYDDTGPIPGAVAPTYKPAADGKYWAQVRQNGCTDSTAIIPFFIHPLPKAIFTPVLDTGCLTSNNTRVLTNASTGDGSTMTYLWKFSDGDLQQTTDATKKFTKTGPYTVELVTTTASGCKDSTTGLINIFPNGIPAFTWDSVCTNRTALFKNVSDENGSSKINYNWNFNNGGAGSVLKDPLPVSYTVPGKTDVTLTITAFGCENDPKLVTRSVLVNKAATGVRYRDITVPLGSSQFVHVRDSVGKIYNWHPPINLSTYTQRYTEFFAVSDDVKYLIDITDGHTCVATDTLNMLVLKKPGYYLPTAFTPNGDGLNDVAIPYLVGMKSLKSFSVFNRWGTLVFYTKTYNEGWDGKSKGIEQAAGVYVWILEFVNSDDKPVTEKGTITIIR